MEGFCRFVCVFFVPFVLQGVGFLAPNWISNTHCSKLGLFYRCCGTEECIIDNADTYINKSALALQATAFVILLLTVLIVGYTLCKYGDDWDSDSIAAFLCQAVCSGLMYPAAGGLIIAGCVLIATDNKSSTLGYSFFLAVFAAAFIVFRVLYMFLRCFQNCCGDGDDGEYTSRYDSRPGTSHGMSVSATGSSGEPVSSGVAYIRRIQIVRIV